MTFAPYHAGIREVSAPPLRRSAVNLAALACIQGANAILPLLAFPLILIVVGSDGYSRVALTESIMFVGLALVNYSFDVEGVSSIAGLDLQRDRARISRVFSEILLARLLLFGGCALALLLAAPFLDRTGFLLLAGWLLFPFSYVLQSTWFFQGLERNVVPAVVIVASRIICLVLIRVWITGPADVVRAPLIIGGSYAAGGAVLLLYIVAVHGVSIERVPVRAAWQALLRGKEIFAGNISVVLYRGANVMILSAFSTSAAVVTYSLAEKAIKLFQAGATPLNQLFFPKAIKALRHVTVPGRGAFRATLRCTIPQLGLLAVGGAGLAVVLIYFRSLLPPQIASALGPQTLGLVAIMSGTVFFGVANFMFGTGGLNHLGKRAYFAKAILATGLANLVLCSTLVVLLGATGAALSFVLSEVLLFALVLRAYFPASIPAPQG